MNTSVFIIPGSFVKNGDERLVVLNRIAMSVAESMRGKHATHVFCYQGKPVLRMLNGLGYGRGVWWDYRRCGCTT